MTIGPAIPGVPVAAELTAGVPGEAAGAADMFGDIIAGMAAALGAEATDAEAAPGEQVEKPTTEGDPAAAIAQLLALTVRQQGKARKEPEADAPAAEQPMGECEVTVSALGKDGSGIVSLAVPGAVPAQAQLPTAEPAKAELAKAEAAPATPHVAKQPKEPKPAPVIEVDQPAKAETKSPVALAIAELMQATRQLGLPVARRAAPEPVVTGNEPVPQNFGQEVKQVVHAAISSMQAQPAPLPLEIARPLETLLEPVAVEPQLDLSEVAIERQLDVSAEGEWLDSLAKDIARTAGEGGTLRFKLNPENLGTLRVEITPQANGSAVRLTADTDAARTIIADAQTRLMAEAKANGVRISETHVDLGGQAPSGDPRRQNATFEETPIRTARFLRDQEESDGKPTPSKSERYA